MWVFKYVPLTKTKTLHTGRTLHIARVEAPRRVLVLSGLVLGPWGGGKQQRQEGHCQILSYTWTWSSSVKFLTVLQINSSRLHFCQGKHRNFV
jgi:hypothetical protein